MQKNKKRKLRRVVIILSSILAISLVGMMVTGIFFLKDIRDYMGKWVAGEVRNMEYKLAKADSTEEAIEIIKIVNSGSRVVLKRYEGSEVLAYSNLPSEFEVKRSESKEGNAALIVEEMSGRQGLAYLFGRWNFPFSLSTERIVEYQIPESYTGSIEVNTGAGSIEVEGDFQHLILNSKVGSILFRGNVEDLRVDSGVGSVDIQLLEERSSRIGIESDVGSVDVLVPNADVLFYEVKSDVGSVDVDFPPIPEEEALMLLYVESNLGSVDIHSR